MLESIGVNYENGDTIYEAYGIGGSVPFYTKIMDDIKIDTFTIENFEIDVGMLPEEHNGLLGLDVLKQYNFIVDLEKLKLFPSTQEKGDLDWLPNFPFFKGIFLYSSGDSLRVELLNKK